MKPTPLENLCFLALLLYGVVVVGPVMGVTVWLDGRRLRRQRARGAR